MGCGKRSGSKLNGKRSMKARKWYEEEKKDDEVKDATDKSSPSFIVGSSQGESPNKREDEDKELSTREMLAMMM